MQDVGKVFKKSGDYMKEIYSFDIWIGYKEQNEFMEGILKIIPFYYANQISNRISLEDGKIEGCVALDYLEGVFEKDVFKMTINNFDTTGKLHFISQLKEQQLSCGEKIVLKGTYKKNLYCIILIQEMIETIEDIDLSYQSIEYAKSCKQQ